MKRALISDSKYSGVCIFCDENNGYCFDKIQNKLQFFLQEIFRRLITVMLPNNEMRPSCHNHTNIVKLCANFALFALSLSSICFGQILAIAPSYPSHSTRKEARNKGFTNAKFPSDTEANIVLGGLFPVRSKNTTNHGPGCGSLNVERGIHRLEAMIFAVDQINKDPNLLRNVTLGMIAYDTCGWYTRALEESLEFVMAKTTSINCPNPFSASSDKDRILAGVVGAAASSVSVQVANLLRLFNLPQISYASTTPDLSDKVMYDYFVRTVPPDNYQARAMVDIVRGLNWNSVFTVSSEGIYGERGIREFIIGARAVNICIAGSFKIEDGLRGKRQIDDMFNEFFKHPNVRGVVLFCTDIDSRRILEESQRRKSAGKYIWVASDYWGTRRKTIKGLEEFAEGAITVSLTEASIPLFTDYFTSLKPGNHSLVNPWFESFWEKQFQCSLKEAQRTCGERLSLRNLDMRIDDKVPFVIDAVYALAHGLDKMYKSLCPSQQGLCSNMIENFSGKNLRDTLFNVSFTGMAGHVMFDSNGNGPGKYDIYRLEGGRYEKVASWNDELHNATKLYNGGKNGSTPLSSCGEPCLRGYYKLFDFAGSCCWICKECPDNNYLKDGISCHPCQQGERANADRTGCEPLPQRHIAQSWLIMVMVFAGLGIMCTLLVGILFIVHSDTPLVKASGRELTYALIFGLLSCYVSSFFLMAKPSVIVCVIQRVGMGFSFCLCYAAVLIRTNRIARIFERSPRSTKPPILIKPASQIAILAVFIIIDIAFAGIGLAKWPPETVFVLPTKKDVLLMCNIQTYDTVCALTYNALIILLCTYYAFRTRKTPENFNEARYIAFAMYTTCIIWVSFIPVQFGVNKEYATITISINTTLNATTLLLCIFGPKVYILVFRPTRNLASKSLNSRRSQDIEQIQVTDRGSQSESQITEVPNNKSVEQGTDNPALENGRKSAP